MKRVFCYIFLLLGLYACDPIDTKLSITNNSNERIYYIELPYDSLFKDESLLERYDSDVGKYLDFLQPIDPGETRSPLMFGRFGRGWKDYISRVCEDKKLKVFILKEDLVDSIPWNIIVNNNIYSELRIYTLSDLDSIDWNIVIE